MCSSEAVCRVCLAGGDDVRVHAVQGKQLLETYEKLTRLELRTRDGRPNTLCSICLSRLQMSNRFSVAALEAEQILGDLLRNNTVINYRMVAALNLKKSHLLSATTAQHISTDEYIDQRLVPSANQQYCVCVYDTTLVTVKEKRVVVKEEASQDNIIVPENVQEDPEYSSDIEEKQTKFSNETKNSNYLSTDKYSKKIDKVIPKTHSNLENKFVCHQCDKTFNYAAFLNRHMRSHTRAYVCDRCSKAFKLKSALEAHLRTHSGEKPFACTALACGKAFRQRSHLRTHARTHCGDKPFSCDECGRGFRQRAQLHSHARTHSGEKPFACDRCDATFGHLTTLRKHRRLHNAERAHACERCALSFARAGALATHLTRRHAGASETERSV